MNQDWPEPTGEVPPPTYWPALLAVGLTAIGWGLVSTWMVSAAGAVFALMALIGWIVELAKAPRANDEKPHGP